MLTKRNCGGFSLIELAIVMTIMGFLLSLGFPMFRDWMASSNVRNAAESFQNGLQLARMEALRRNWNVTFWLISSPNPKVLGSDCTVSASGTSWVVSANSPAGKCATAPSISNDPMIVQVHAAGDGNISAASATTPSGAKKVTFNGLGRVVSDSDTITRIDITPATTNTNVRNLRIVVTGAGLVRMCDPAVSDTNDPRICP